VVQSTESRQRDDLAQAGDCRRGSSTTRRVLSQSEMSSVFVVIADVFFQQPSQVSLVQNDHVVEQVSTHTSNLTLGDAVLPRTSKRGSYRLTAVLLDGPNDVSRALRVPVEDQEPLWLILSPSFAQLKYDPKRVWIACDVVVQDLPPVVTDDKETWAKLALVLENDSKPQAAV
jgi:hypothetical protein